MKEFFERLEKYPGVSGELSGFLQDKLGNVWNMVSQETLAGWIDRFFRERGVYIWITTFYWSEDPPNIKHGGTIVRYNKPYVRLDAVVDFNIAQQEAWIRAAGLGAV